MKKKSTEPFTQARIEKLIRTRSRTSPEVILEAARYAGSHGWFALSLRLLDGMHTRKGARAVSFEHRWIHAQTLAAMNDFTGALRALEMDGDCTPAQLLKRKSLELVLNLSIAEWQAALGVGKDLIQLIDGNGNSFEKARLQILYAVALLHGEHQFERASALLIQAQQSLGNAGEMEAFKRRSLERQIELFEGQCAYLAGDDSRARSVWLEASKNEQSFLKDKDEGPLHLRVFGLWVLLAEIRMERAKGGQGLKGLLKRYDQELSEFCLLDPSVVAEQMEGHLAEALDDIQLARQLWLGGIYPGYRKGLESVFRSRLFESSEDIVVHVFSSRKNRSQTSVIERDRGIELDAWTGQVGSAKGASHSLHLKIKPGQALQRLLETLALARYGGLTAFDLHRRIFPDERFSPTASPAKVRTLVYRLRRELAAIKICLTIEESKDRYQLGAEQDVAIRIRWVTDRAIQELARPSYKPGSHSRAEPIRSESDPLKQQVYRQIVLLQRSLKSESFTILEALPLLGLRRSRATQVLTMAVQNGWLSRKTLKREVRYTFLIGAQAAID